MDVTQDPRSDPRERPATDVDGERCEARAERSLRGDVDAQINHAGIGPLLANNRSFEKPLFPNRLPNSS
jgi:hypothetical protein